MLDRADLPDGISSLKGQKHRRALRGHKVISSLTPIVETTDSEGFVIYTLKSFKISVVVHTRRDCYPVTREPALYHNQMCLEHLYYCRRLAP